MASSLLTIIDDRSLSSRELREKYNAAINSDPALVESRRWIEDVTRRYFPSDDFRESLANGILLCELVEIVGDLKLGRINRLPNVTYAGIDNLNMFFQACEKLGLKKLHLFDITDLHEVSSRGGASISTKAKETQRRLHNVAITILWLAKAAQNQGYQGYADQLDVSCFAHLLPETQFQGRPSREGHRRKRHSVGEELELKSRGSDNLPPKKRDKVFDKIDIKDRKEKFRNLEQEEKKQSEKLELDGNRRKSTGGILSRYRGRSLDDKDGRLDRKENTKPSSKMPDPKLHEKQEFYSRRDQQAEMESAVLKGKAPQRGSGVTSPPPVSLGGRVEVDLKEKQKRFEGLDQQAGEQSAVLSGKVRPVSWGPGENRQALKKQNQRDVGFKEKHKNFEEIQRQAEKETAVLQGKLRPELDKNDGRPSKVSLSSKADVKLREKRKSFEKRDYQAQRESAVLQGNLRLSSTDGKEKRPQSTMVPKGTQIKLGEKKATFEQLDKQAEQDISILRGTRRPPVSDDVDDGHKRSSKVGLPRDTNVSLLEKQRTFEQKDFEAKRESEILQKNTRTSFTGSVKESRPLSTSTRPQMGRVQSPSDRQWDSNDVNRRPQQDRRSRPVSNYYEYRSLNDDFPEQHRPLESASSEDRVYQVSREEPMETTPSFEEDEGRKQRHFTLEDAEPGYNKRDSLEREVDSDYIRRRAEKSRRRRYSGDDEQLEFSDVAGDQKLSDIDARNLSYRDLVRAPRKISRETFIREKNNARKVEEMPWRKEVREVKDKRNLLSDEEQDEHYTGRPTSPRSELGKAQYLELVVPPSKRALDNFSRETETAERGAEEMPWRKEVREIKRSPSGEEPPFFSSQVPPEEVTRIRPPMLKTRDVFVTSKDEEDQEEMPWRKEVREFKERPRTEDEEDPQEDEIPSQHESSTEPNVRDLSYRDFIHQPSKKRRDIFQPHVETERQEMPWRKEAREIKRTPTEEELEDEQLQQSSATVVHSLPGKDTRQLSYNDFAARPSKRSRDVFRPTAEKEKEEMPWRKEVREFKRTPTEEELEEEKLQQSSVTVVHSSPATDPRQLSYKDFAAKPSQRSRGVFRPTAEKEKEEMPWRKEVREIKRTPTEDELEDEQMQQSSATVVHSSPATDPRQLSYSDFAAKPSKRPSRDVFRPTAEKEKEEMPWRKEVRQLRERPPDEQTEEYQSNTIAEDKPNSQRGAPSMTYHDFVPVPSRKPREAFVHDVSADKEEMPWRREVRELRDRPVGDDEQIHQQSSNAELESAYDDSSTRGFTRPSKWTTEDKHEISKDAWFNGHEKTSRNMGFHSGSQSSPDVRKLSYHDFVCPPSKMSQDTQAQEQKKRKAKVKDLTRRFADIEAEQNRPKASGHPSRKSLVDKAELQRIERDMRTRSWHGYPADDPDDDYDTRERRRIMSEEEEEERFRERHQRENVSGLEQFNDVFQDPEGYFDQIQGPPPLEKNQEAEREAPAQYEAPSWKDSDDRRYQFSTERFPAEYTESKPRHRDVQFSSYAATQEDRYENEPFRDEPIAKHNPSDRQVVVTQSWIQPQHVEVAETSPYVLEKEAFEVEQWQPPVGSKEDHRRTDRTDRGNEDSRRMDQGPFIPERSHLKDEMPYNRDFPTNDTSVPSMNERRNEEVPVQRTNDREEKYERKERSYFLEENNQRDQRPLNWEIDNRSREEPARVPQDQERAMVFGAPIVVTAKPRAQQQPHRTEPAKGQSGAYEFVPAKVTGSEERNEVKSAQNEKERIEIVRSLVLEDIRKLGKKDVAKPPEKDDADVRPHTYAVFGLTGQHQRAQPRERPQEIQRDDSEVYKQQAPDAHQMHADTPERRRGQMRFLDESEQQDTRDWYERSTEEPGKQDVWYGAPRDDLDEEGYYENSVTSHTELHPVVVSAVESQALQWGAGAFDASPQKEAQKGGRMRVMNFTSNSDDERVNKLGNDNILSEGTQPVRPEPLDADRRKEQREKEELVKEQLHDADYRAKYRKELEEKNRKQRENSKYLMSLQMRASLDEDDAGFDEDKLLQDERALQDYYEQTGRSGRDGKPGKEDSVQDERLVKMVAAEEKYWHKKMERKKEEESTEAGRHERPRRIGSDEYHPRINGIDFVGDEAQFRSGDRIDFEQEERLRKLKAEEEFMAQEAERMRRERSILKPVAQVEEPIVIPSEKPPVEFAFDEEMFKAFLAEEQEKHIVDENSNRNPPHSRTSGLKSSYYYDDDYKTPESELTSKEKLLMRDSNPKPLAEVRPVNGHHYENEDHRKAPWIENEDRRYEDDFPTHPEEHPEMNGFAGYSIYETFIHGESNHVICSHCGTSIEKSLSMYVAELDRYWHQDCFCCVVCRAWFGDEDSPVLHITNSMLHCERCFITDDGERCTEV